MQPSAFVAEVQGRASLIRAGGAAEPLRLGDTLREGDSLLVSEGRVRVAFADGSRLTIIDGGQLLLRQVAYDSASKEGQITVAAAAGHFQFQSGDLGELAPSVILIETPAGNIHPGRSPLAFQHTSGDGLSVSLLEASPSDSPPLTVDNAVGSIALSDLDQRITAAAADSAPILARHPEGPESPLIEVSAGGDENAFPGDPIVVTGAPDFFDLSPEAAPLAEPSLGPLSPGASPPPDPTHHGDDLLAGGQAAWLAEGASSSESASAGSKYRTLTGWEPLNLVWELNGSGQVTGEAPTFPYGRDSLQIQPTEKNSMAGLALASEQVPLVELEQFFGFDEGSFARLAKGGVEGSGIRAPLSLSAGAELSFDFFFDAGDTLPRNDFALALVGKDTLRLLDIAAIASAPAMAHIDASGWRTVVYKVPESGVYTIGFASIDDRTAADPSALYIDNVRIDRQFGADWVVVAQEGSWRTLVQPAVARDDWLTIGEDAVFTAPEAYVLANDTDPDPFDPMHISGIDHAGTVGTASYASGGMITYKAAGLFDYLAEGESAADSFRYLVNPGNGVTSMATVHVTIVGANDVPVARADTAVVAADANRNLIDVLRNDDDVDSDDDSGSLRIVEAHAAFGTVSSTGQPGQGLAYTPGAHYVYLGVGDEAAKDSITYVVEDRHGARATATVGVTVSGVNDAPIPRDDAASTNEDAAITVAVLANDTDPDQKDQVSVAGVEGLPINGDLSVAVASGAMVTLNARGRLGYDPRGAFDRLALGEITLDNFRYEVADNHGGVAQARVVVRIEGRNDAPAAGADYAKADENGPSIAIDVLANDDDIDSDDDASSLRIVASQVASGADVAFSGLAGAGLRYDPAGRFEYLGVGETAIDTITYRIEDRHGARATGTAEVTVIGANDAPTANDDRASIDEDSTLALPLLANDTDPDRTDRLQVTAIAGSSIAPGGRVTLASGASVTMDVAGTLAYDPRGNFDSLARDDTATDSFRYRIADGHGGSSEAVATVTIIGRNDAPTAGADTATVAEDGPAVFIDVLANDDDVDIDDAPRDLRVLAAQAASGAPVTFSRAFGDGITYHPWGRFESLDEGETAIDAITYTVADRRGGESTGTVTITVAGANDAPSAAADLLMIDANATLELPKRAGLLANDYDVDNPDDDSKELLRIVAVDGQSANVGATITLASGALLTVNTDGSLRDDPNGKFDGLTDFERAIEGFSYTIVDEHGAATTTTATISIQGRNDPPVANADRSVTDQDSAVRIPVLINEADPDAGGNLRVLSVDWAQTRGSVRMNADGTLTYDPADGFSGLRPGETATDTFSYVVDDFVGGRGTAVVTVTVSGVARPQITRQELIQSFEVGPLPNPSWGFLPQANEAGARLDVVLHAGPVSFRPTHLGTMLLLQADGTDAREIEYYLSDDLTFGGRPLVHFPEDSIGGSSATTGAASKSTLSLAGGDLVGGRITLSFDWNFISGEAQPALTSLNDFAVFSVTDGIAARVYKLAEARHTSGISDGWRTSVYEVTANFSLPARGDLKLTLGFAVLNDQSADHPSQLLVDNVRLNHAPGDDQELVSTDGALATYRERPQAMDDAIAALDGRAVSEDQSVSFGADRLLANDTASRGVDGATMRIIGLDTQAMTGTAALSGSLITFNPANHFDFLGEGQTGTDRFRYIVGDGNGGIDVAEVTITVAGRNDDPIAGDDTLATDEATRLTVAASALLTNDKDPDAGDGITLIGIDASRALGAVSFNGTTVSYDPGTHFRGLGADESATDTIIYTIEDGHRARATGSALVTVVGLNDAPMARPDQGATDEDTAISLAVLSNDTDPDVRDRLFIGAINGTAVTLGAKVSLASGATASVGADGALHYDPAMGFSHLARGQTASDTFTYTALDGHGGASTAAVTISVSGRNDAPIAVGDLLSATAATPLAVAASSLLANDVDPDAGDAVTLVGLDSGSTRGAVSFDGTTVSYDPTAQFRGLGEGETVTDVFTYRIADRDGAPDTGTVSVHVRGVNDAPVAGDDGAATDEDRAITIDVRANDTDPDTHDGLPTIASVDMSGTRGLVTLNADGSITYDPRGRFDSLNNGDVAHDFFTYRITDGHGATDEGAVSIEIAGRSDTERLIDSFEAPFSAANRTTSIVTTVGQYQETAGASPYLPTDGHFMAKLEAYGTSAQKIGSQTVSALEGFLGVPDRSLPRDQGDNTLPANGSACKLKVNVEAGDEISFDWMFDARDFVNAPPDGKSDNDYAVFTVVGGTGPELFKLSDVRQTGDQGASGWRSSIYTARTTGELTVGFGVVNDRVADAVGQGSVLLVDNLRFNRDFGHGYQLVDHQADGHFETVVLTN